MTEQTNETILENARIVLADRVIERGWIAVVDGRICEIGEGAPPQRGENFAGDLAIPGLVELHTDHLEAHFMPRPKVYWDPLAAVVSYDSQLAVSGITTVLDSLRIWRDDGDDDQEGQADMLAEAIATARTADLLRADHFLHLRCEIPMPLVISDAARLVGRPDVRLISLMDHTPGQRQFRDEAKLRTYYRGKKGGLTDAELDLLFASRHVNHAKYAVTNRRGLVDLAKAHAVSLASHDDTIEAHVEEAVQDGVAIAEFPTTFEAAEQLHAAGIKVLMGAPNLVRGGSHSGNVATADLARIGVLDIMSSDYLPASLLLAALRLPDAVPSIDLATAVRTVTKSPAEAVGLCDRGEIAVGKRADLVRVHVAAGLPATRAVWRAGRRVA
jgi:alpha-D-ribose 1-methylphosphonate 5-triphosphate diphosphatase